MRIFICIYYPEEGKIKDLSDRDNCYCIDHVSVNGFGNCNQLYKGEPICYVKEPSSCDDLVPSTTEGGKMYSWMACKCEYYIILVKNWYECLKYNTPCV